MFGILRPKNMRKMISRVTLEPTLMFFFTSINFSRFLGYNLLLRKACDPTLLYEPDLNEKCLNEIVAQHRVANINTWKSLCLYILPMIFLLIAGPWSDNHGNRRRPLIFIPIIGHILTDLACCLNAYFWNWSPEVAAIFEIIGPGLTGGETALMAGSICYMSDISNEKNRTWRISMIVLIYVACGPIGAGCAGILNIKLGFLICFLISAHLNLIALILGIILIKDVSMYYDKNKTYSISTIIGFDNLINCLKILTKPRLNLKRLILNISLILRSITVSRIMGEATVVYLFTRRKFNWHEAEYSYFTAYKLVVTLIGTVFSMAFLSYRLQMSDPMIGFISITIDTIAVVMYFFVQTPLQIYLVAAVDMFSGAAYTVLTSMCTKCVEFDELGRLNTVKATIGALFPMSVAPIYSFVYDLTLEFLPSAFYIISFILSVPVAILFCFLYKLNSKQVANIMSDKKGIDNFGAEIKQ